MRVFSKVLSLRDLQKSFNSSTSDVKREIFIFLKDDLLEVFSSRRVSNILNFEEGYCTQCAPFPLLVECSVYPMV
jgi:hypothetical protein